MRKSVDDFSKQSLEVFPEEPMEKLSREIIGKESGGISTGIFEEA